MGEEKSRDITGITVRYSDGSTKEIQSGCCVDLEKGSDDLSVEMLNVKPFDLYAWHMVWWLQCSAWE